MKPLKILVIMCIILSFGLKSIKAQIPPSSSYQATNKISSLQIGNLSPAHWWLNTSRINCQVKCLPVLADLTRNPGCTFDSTCINYHDFINTHTLLNWANVKLPVELAAKEHYGTSSTLKIKWESYPRIPFIDPAMAYYCPPFKRTDELTLYNCRLYRTAAFIIPRMLQFQYPGAQNTIIYPPAYLQPNYSFIERSK
jgi:hypothetical protein